MATANGNHPNRNILGTNTSSLVPGVVNLTCGGAASAAVAAAAAAGGSHSSSWGCQMDALVSDLSHALDESHKLQRKRRPFRRRANQSKGNGCCSDYSSSSAEDAVHTGGANSQDNKSSMHLTDSDEGVNRCARVPRYRPARTLRPPRAAAGLVESDSVNENFSPASRPSNMRRKPKCKRLALDVAGDAVNSSSCRSARWRSSLVVHRVHTLHAPARWSALCGGKRKRSRDGACGGEGRGDGEDLVLSSWTPSMSFASSRCCNGNSGRQRSSELVGGTSTSGGGDCSISSDESDGGELPADGNDAVHCEVFTCDEGREADDEQSDWVTEVPGPVYGVPSPSTAMACDEAGSGGTLYSSRLRFQKIRERILRREIRAGRRRLRDRRPGHACSASSVSESVTRFLQDPQASELQLQPSSVAEQDELQRLAQLYSLHLRVAEEPLDASQQHPAPANSCFVTKTRNTTTTQQQQQCLSPPSFPSLSLHTSFSAASPPAGGAASQSFSSLVHCSQSPSQLPPALQALSQEAISCSDPAGASNTSFPWGLPTPLSDVTKKRRKVPTSPSFVYSFSSPAGGGGCNIAGGRHALLSEGAPLVQAPSLPAPPLVQAPSLPAPPPPAVEDADMLDQTERLEGGPYQYGEDAMAS